MKNTPITARAKAASSPSKVKGYTMKSSPFKQVNTERYDQSGNVIVGSEDTVKSAGGILREEIKRNKTFDDLRKEGMSEADITKAKAWRKKNPDAARDQVGTGEFKEVQGDPKEVKVKKEVKLKTKDKGDAQTPYERRQALRAAKRVARAQKSEQRKTDRLDRKEGTATKTKKQQRIDRKRTQIKTNKAVADAEARNVINQAKQNISTTSTKNVMSDDRYVTQGERTEGQQKKAGKTVKSAFTPKKVNTNIGFEARDVKSGFFKKKSPMKMNYFKK